MADTDFNKQFEDIVNQQHQKTVDVNNIPQIPYHINASEL